VEGGGRKVTMLGGFFAPRQRGGDGEKGHGRDTQLRERGGVRYSALERGGGGVWRPARRVTDGRRGA
jgi:hypothetical protein